jgi:hypothetical protein
MKIRSSQRRNREFIKQDESQPLNSNSQLMTSGRCTHRALPKRLGHVRVIVNTLEADAPLWTKLSGYIWASKQLA